MMLRLKLCPYTRRALYIESIVQSHGSRAIVNGPAQLRFQRKTYTASHRTRNNANSAMLIRTSLIGLLQLPMLAFAEWATCVKAKPNANGVWATLQLDSPASCIMKAGATEPPARATRQYNLKPSW